MALKWIPWLVANEFVHMRSFLVPLIDHESIPPDLRRRIRTRIKSGIRLIKIRAVVYAIMFPAILAVAASVIFIALEELLGAGLVDGLESVFALVLQVVGFLFVIAAIALFIVQRSLQLLRVDVYMLSMEAVALGIKAGGPTPSTQNVQLRKPKMSSSRSDR